MRFDLRLRHAFWMICYGTQFALERVRGRKPLVVFQMGKVGSQSLVETLVHPAIFRFVARIRAFLAFASKKEPTTTASLAL